MASIQAQTAAKVVSHMRTSSNGLEVKWLNDPKEGSMAEQRVYGGGTCDAAAFVCKRSNLASEPGPCNTSPALCCYTF